MKRLPLCSLTAFLVLAACSSKEKNKFDPVGKEEIRIEDGKAHVVNTKSLDQALDVERVKRESAERQAIAWKEDYQQAKTELMQARVALGLPAERRPCNPCKPGQITPTSTIQEELDQSKRARKKAKRQEEKEDAAEIPPPATDDSI